MILVRIFFGRKKKFLTRRNISFLFLLDWLFHLLRMWETLRPAVSKQKEVGAIWGKPNCLLVWDLLYTFAPATPKKMNMSRLRDVLMENKWNTFCKSPHMFVKVCLTCHGKRSDWFEKMTICTNIEVLGGKRDHREIWWSGRGAMVWLAI